MSEALFGVVRPKQNEKKKRKYHVFNQILSFKHKPLFKIFTFAMIVFFFLTMLSIWKFGNKEQRLVTIPLKNHRKSEIF